MTGSSEKGFGTLFRELPGHTSDLCIRLLHDQKETWAACREGYERFLDTRDREVRCNGFSVVVQHNPGRAASTEARVGEAEIAQRPCFLCKDRRPPGQKGIVYRNEYIVLVNPMPLFPAHYTVISREHRPQAIAENAHAMLQLVEDLGPGWTVLYNGPRCGASAPDHLHFQVATGGRMPIEKEIWDHGRLVEQNRFGDIALYRIAGIGREAAMFEGKQAPDLLPPILSYLKGLSRVSELMLFDGRDDAALSEPMVNIAAYRNGEKAVALIFPRRTHRPSAYFRSGDERIVVSPAAAEMGGIIVTPVERDFERLTAGIVEEIFREVSIDEEAGRRAVEAVTV
jgi:diadenosine tetraphosphate (Ap4A) HIT family hydrolase